MRYDLQFSPMAQSQLGVVPGEVFQSIRRELEALAELAGLKPAPGEPTLPVPQAFAMGEFAVLFRVEHENRSLTVVEIVRRMWDCA